MSRDRWICTECRQWFYADEGDDPESNLCQRCQSGDTPDNYIENHCLEPGLPIIPKPFIG